MSTTTTPQNYRQCKQNGSLNYTTETYSYNPFTSKLPSTTEHWKYIKYKPKDNNFQSSFNFPKPTDAVDNNIWVLYGGSGGYGGTAHGDLPSNRRKYGGGGGGGTGELKLSLLNKTTFTSIGCTIGKLNNQYSRDYNASTPNGTSQNYNYNTTSATTLAIKNTTTTAPPTDTTTDTLIDTLKATGGFCGQWINSKAAGEGGYGANVMVYNGTNLVANRTTITYDTTTITTIPFGSMGGGAGWDVDNGGDANMGDRYELINQSGSATKFDYKYVDVVQREDRVCDGDNSGVLARFNISLSGVQCDNTGSARILRPGDGAHWGYYGAPSEGGFIMFFYKTSVPLTSNNNPIKKKSYTTTAGVTKYNYNPLTGKIPGQIDDDFDNPGNNWIYYKYEKYALELLIPNYMPSFYVESKYIVGNYCWALVGGPGGFGGFPGDNKDGSGGGGGGGEVVLAKIEKWRMPYVFGSSSESRGIQIEYRNSGSILVTAYGGDDGRQANNKNGAGGGNGGGAKNGATFDISKDHSDDYRQDYAYSYRFGSGKGGAGEANGYGKTTGICGKYMTPSLQSNSTKIYDYKLLGADNDRTKTGSGVTVDFGISLGGQQCDNTGFAYDISRGGNGGKTTQGISRSGEDGAEKFVMFFYETTDSGALK